MGRTGIGTTAKVGESFPLHCKNKPAVRTLTAILRRAELTREFRFPFSDFCENHDHLGRRASLCDRRHGKVRYRRSGLAALPGDELR